MESAAVRIQLGDVLADKYRVERVLGEGGMGVVYGVVDVGTGAPLAMKVVTNAQAGESVTRFFREGRATMKVQSDHVVRVFDVGSIEGKLPYMVMERLEGTTLKALVEKAPLDERSAADLIIQACEGLAHAHASGIVHRDVKPSNLFVLDGAELHLKVLDFGISRMASLEDWERTATVTESNALLGSPQYISPEQLQSPSGVDDRTDVWSLGVTMYYALSGKLPFEGMSLAELLVAVMSRPPIPITTRCRVGAAMNEIVSKCLERALDRRFRHVSDLARALAPLASPRCVALALRVSSIIANAAPPLASARPPPPAPADKTLTVTEPIPSLDREPTLAVGGAAPSGSTRWQLAVEPHPPPPRSRAGMFVGLALAAALAVAGGALAVSRARAPAPPATALLPTSSEPTSTGPVPSPPPPASAAEPPPADTASSGAPQAPQLELVADAPITKVIRPASRRVALEDGKAIVTVGAFRGELAIEVELANGGRARGTAREGGPTSIHLVTTKGTRTPPPTARPAAARGTTPRATPSTTPSDPRATPTTTPSDLHGTPYE